MRLTGCCVRCLIGSESSPRSSNTSRARELPTYLAWPSATPQVREGKRAPGGCCRGSPFPGGSRDLPDGRGACHAPPGVGRGLVEALEADLIADGSSCSRSRPSARRGLMLATTGRGSSTRPWASGRWRSFTAYGPKTLADNGQAPPAAQLAKDDLRKSALRLPVGLPVRAVPCR